jgi:hypothetical protein
MQSTSFFKKSTFKKLICIIGHLRIYMYIYMNIELRQAHTFKTGNILINLR